MTGELVRLVEFDDTLPHFIAGELAFIFQPAQKLLSLCHFRGDAVSLDIQLGGKGELQFFFAGNINIIPIWGKAGKSGQRESILSGYRQADRVDSPDRISIPPPATRDAQGDNGIN